MIKAIFAARCIEHEILIALTFQIKSNKDVSLHDPIGTDKEGNEISLIDILGTDADDVVDKVQLKIEKSKIYRNLDILEYREKVFVVARFELENAGDEKNAAGDCKRDWNLTFICFPNRKASFINKVVS
ncbi:hypothetical protein J41TS12_05790 [Paenibacillus antibioticophila]|uniref:Uncharacterized protein n=1 Tax=Paenibacillus antibioticophila TaxID=1274374 RepID=A0A919XSV5_9BACL|nr:hypothetical protein J41TS12_05790 [Paenibacillus antibioticophila]